MLLFCIVSKFSGDFASDMILESINTFAYAIEQK